MFHIIRLGRAAAEAAALSLDRCQIAHRRLHQRLADIAVAVGPARSSSNLLSNICARMRSPSSVDALLPPLQTVIKASPRGHLTFLVTKLGKPFSDAGIGNWFRKRCDEAKLFHCSAHGLRKAGASIAADVDATDEQMMALFGWKTRKQVSTYTRGANQKKLALVAGNLISTALIENGIVPPPDRIEPEQDDASEKVKEIK